MKSFSVVPLAFMVVVLPIIAADITQPDQRYLEAYTELDCTGPVHVFYDYVPDLRVYLIDNAIQSIRITGTWILYVDYNYNEDDDRILYHGIDRCYGLSSAFPQAVSSLRYAGSPYGLNDVYYNLYEGTYWAGLEFTGNTNSQTVLRLDQNVSSLVITGQSPWTFFTGLSYTGVGVCVLPGLSEISDDVEYDYFYVSSMSLIDLPDNSIRSVAKGCLTERVVRLSPSKAAPGLDSSHEENEIVH